MPASMAELEKRAKRRLGTVLRGKYTLERVLGAGGMAAVYLGVHRNGHRVAIKMLHREVSLDPDLCARFVREGYLANAIEHPGTVRVLDDDVTDDGSAFLVMELLEGETLFARAKRSGGRLSSREALVLGRELCDVLAAAHDKGIVHRDIKPENLFLTTHRVLKVLDFGIAHGGDAPGAVETGGGAALGTPAFMPPEQALGRSSEVDARSDVWSVGATLFSLISGYLVHEADTRGALLVAAATRPARSLAVAAPRVQPPIVAVVDRALAFVREDRWPSARAMRDALADAYTEVFHEPLSVSALGPVCGALPSLDDPVPGTRRRAEGTSSPAPGGPTAAAEDVYYGETLPASGGGASGGGGGVATLPVTTTTGSVEKDSPPRLSPASVPTATPVPTPAAPTFDPGETRVEGRGSGPRQAASTSELQPRERAREREEAQRPRAAPRSAPGLLAALAFVAFAAILAVAVFAVRTKEMHAMAPIGGGGCTESRACTAANGGKAAICRKADHTCVPLASEDCRVLAEPGDVENDATVWVGAMFPLHGPAGKIYGERELTSVDLARRDFAQTGGGLPPPEPGGRPRPLAVVACDDEEAPLRAARHLVDDVGVPAIVGFARSKEVADLAGALFTPKGVLALASNTATMLRAIPKAPGQPRMVWRTTTSSDMNVPAEAALIEQVIEPALRAAGVKPDEPLRVALARVGNASGLGYADVCVSALRFNGKSVAENGPSFRQMVFADPESDDQARAELARVAAEIAAFRPHVVIEAVDHPLEIAVEAAWPPGERFRPWYVGVRMSNDGTRAYARDHADARRRMFRVDTTTSTPVVAKLVLRHNEVFDQKVTAVNVKGAPYDAFYTLAYAIAAAGREPLTGPSLARALSRLVPPGEPLDVGPAGIYPAFAALGSGKNIDLQGTVTSLDFDPETGDPTADMAVYCLAPPAGDALPEPVESGLVFRGRTRKLEGTLHCP